jgi:hypothetical protein
MTSVVDVAAPRVDRLNRRSPGSLWLAERKITCFFLIDRETRPDALGAAGTDRRLR